MALAKYFANKGAMSWQAGAQASQAGQAAVTSYPVLNPSMTIEETEFDGGRAEIGQYGLGAARALGSFARVSCGIELFGQTGHAGSLANCWHGGAWLRACGWAESGSTVATYTFGNPHTIAESGAYDPLVSLKRNVDTLQTTAQYLGGNSVVHFSGHQFPYVQFDMLGQKTTGLTNTASSLAVQAQTAFGTCPTTVATASASGTINSATVIWHDLHVDVGNNVDQPPDVNAEYGFGVPRLTGGTPRYTGSFTVPALGTAGTHLWNLALLGTTIPVSLVHNPGVTDNTITFTGSFYLDRLAPIVNRNGVLTYEFSGTQNFASTMPTLAWT